MRIAWVYSELVQVTQSIMLTTYNTKILCNIKADLCVFLSELYIYYRGHLIEALMAS